ncbi:hypothetical protein PLESTB_000203500 [Pleodorina starrii]|uniref:Complex 1 LYR protein domain-containing protein n=1 Tax=Pleodorina starrii TaxID=330485 RepID=A0A9W6BC31_9CHLO|nr:hypothetical protein PLESTM_000328200 [Pleodorina starrii]GLC49293.1 hypothetical protein PLESTB_000203500 [Pleodorina starrii]
MNSNPNSVISLYRHILKAAKFFPSRKRDNIIREIKAEFHANKGLTDPDRITHCRTLAERGLSDLQAYVPTSRSAAEGDIQITLKGATTSF